MKLDGVRRDHLARHHDREARRVRDHEVRRDELGPVLRAACRSRGWPAGCTRSPPRRRPCRSRRACGPRCVAPAGSSRNASWKRLKFGRSGTSSMSDFDARRERGALRRRRRGAAARRSRRAISASTLTRCATSLRVLLMLVCSSTLLREVLLSWISYFDGEQALELRAVEAGGAADQREPRRVQRRTRPAGATRSASAQVSPAPAVVGEARRRGTRPGSCRPASARGSTSRSAGGR